MGYSMWLDTFIYNSFYGNDYFTHFWKLFRYVVNRDHYDKLICIREFLEQLAHYCFNKIKTDT